VIGNDEQLKAKIMQAMHDSTIGGHLGVRATYHRIMGFFYWPGLKKEVVKYVLQCEIYQHYKHETVVMSGLLQPLPISEQVWEDISMDFIEGLLKFEGKDTMLVIVDRLTKFAHSISLTHLFLASEVARVFLDSVGKFHGIPKRVVSDRDKIFTSSFWQELFRSMGVGLHFSTSYHPETNGQTERVNQCLEGYL